MFEINELKIITRLINQPFYLSPKSTFEYIMYHDIDHFEVMVNFDIQNWIMHLKNKFRLVIKEEDNYTEVFFLDERISLKLFKITEYQFTEELVNAKFNVESVAIKVSVKEHLSFNKYEYNNKIFYSSWVDPNHKRLGIRACFIEPININEIELNGNLLYEMIQLMAKYNFDIHIETLNYLIKNRDKIIYENKNLSNQFFEILTYPNASKYIEILNKLNALKSTYPLIKMMDSSIYKDISLWEKGMHCLKTLEKTIYTNNYFSDSVFKAIQRNLNMEYACGLTKLQLIKFSVLFYHAHHVMKLKINAPERYEETFTSFCSFFDLCEDACSYYSQVVENNKKSIINLKEDYLNGNTMSKQKQYEFYEDFQENSLDVLLIQYVDLICPLETETHEAYKRRLEFFIKGYLLKFSEIQSINSEITTFDLELDGFSDASMLLLLEEVKRKVFLGNLRYDRNTIIQYIMNVIKS